MIDCIELEEIIEHWYHLNRIPKPICSAESVITYKSMIVFSKKDLLKKMKRFFQNLSVQDIVITDTPENTHKKQIKILSKL
tara:strand:- start:313 stop:555 length:243 start_codon:yes stop_codon:yes gene_type:complete